MMRAAVSENAPRLAWTQENAADTMPAAF